MSWDLELFRVHLWELGPGISEHFIFSDVKFFLRLCCIYEFHFINMMLDADFEGLVIMMTNRQNANPLPLTTDFD